MDMTEYLSMFRDPRVSDVDIQRMLGNTGVSDVDIQTMRSTLPSARANYPLVQAPMQMKSQEQLAAEQAAINEAIDLNLKKIQDIQDNLSAYDNAGVLPDAPMGTTASEELMQRRQQTPMLQGVKDLVRQVANTINRGEPITQAQKDVISETLDMVGVSVEDFNRAVGDFVQTQRAMQDQAAANPFDDFSIQITDELDPVVGVETTFDKLFPLEP